MITFEEAVAFVSGEIKKQAEEGELELTAANVADHVEKVWKPQFHEIAEAVAPNTYEHTKAAIIAKVLEE